jgi:phage terminase large subunit
MEQNQSALQSLIELSTNVVYRHCRDTDKRILVEQGGTRSGKTYNILMWLIFDYCRSNKGKIVSIVRKTFPAIRASVMRDFFEILVNAQLYVEENHNKSSNEYQLFGNTIEFVSVDQPQKIRGRKRNLLFLNEANELSLEDWRQLLLRTTGRVILDYNPSDEFHWIYEEVLTRDDCEFRQTTYKDNKFLEPEVVAEIERLKDIDENYWRVYGLGERGSNVAAVFQFSNAKQIPEGARFLSFGLDWGFSNDPTACVAVYQYEDNLYIKEIMYRTGCTNREIADILKSQGVDSRDRIYADSAEPKSIEELHRSGFNIHPTYKGADSINVGIDMLKRYKLYVTSDSSNVTKEMRNYKWAQDKNGRLLNKPVDAFNHAIDALRYAVYNTLARPNYGKYAIK